MKDAYSFLQIWGGLIISATSLIIASISLIKASKTQKLQNKVNELEVKLKEYELAKITAEIEAEGKACIEARVINIGKNKNRLKVWNSGNTIAFNVIAKFEEAAGIIMLSDDKMPFDELEPNKNFEVNIIIHYGSASKFKIITEWDDSKGKHHSKTQMGSR